MGHAASKAGLLRLQRRLDKMPFGAPAHRALMEILAELYSDEECAVAAAMPFQLASAGRIGRITGRSRAELEPILASMVEKGLVLDLRLHDGDKPRYFLNPALIGFFEFTMMRRRDSVDQHKLAQLMWEYLLDDPALGWLRMATEGPTFLARPLVHEDVLQPEVVSEVLDWERASALIEDTRSWAEGLCHCRHVKLHQGQPCGYPLGHCLSLGMGAETLVRAGIAEPISKQRALEILAEAREAGQVQMGDNVKKRPTFICNCCKCCCEMMAGFRTLPQFQKVISSNYLARSAADRCIGCGRCVRACPIEAVELVAAAPSPDAPSRTQRARVDEQRCIGCGVCARKCRPTAMQLVFAGERVYTPESAIEKMVAWAVERGKLGNLVFDDHSKLTHRTLSALLNGLLRLPPAKQLLAQKQLKSTFIGLLLEGLKRAPAGRGATDL
jgi:ferredoxin